MQSTKPQSSACKLEDHTVQADDRAISFNLILPGSQVRMNTMCFQRRLRQDGTSKSYHRQDMT